MFKANKEEDVPVPVPLDIQSKIISSPDCPNCGGSELEASLPKVEDIEDAFRCSCQCPDCGSQWEEIYTLTRVENYVEGTKKPKKQKN